MVHKLRCPAIEELLYGRRVACRTAKVVLLCLAVAPVLLAQEPRVHYLHQGVMPPGAIGSRQLQRGGPLPGFFQPVEIKAPAGALVSLAVDGRLDQARKVPLRVGLLIGQVYRLRVMNIPLQPGLEVYPTVEVIDRLYPPPRGGRVRHPHVPPTTAGRRFAIPIELTRQDLELALQGKFVTRVIYLEDPRRALPVRDDPGAQRWFEAGPGRDPLALADQLGRPVAILRLGARLPDDDRGPDMDFLFGCPPFVNYRSLATASPPAKTTPEQAKP
ncbi:MAG: hypothetical protein ACYSWU_04930 [Planctomycetota bacterium]|jgi:hypothetical protein